MLEMTIRIEGLDGLAAAIEKLAGGFPRTLDGAAAAPIPAQTPITPAAPPSVAYTPGAVPSPTYTPAPVPTTAPTYTIEQITNAGAQLVNMGEEKTQALYAVMATFGIQAATQLNPTQYGAFALELRKLGAAI